ncbi:MAG: acyl-CoA/acyl-ACP dehydrogenase [Candidatus Calescibacterium sp.]|nr:acyl-CoA/acyl-ACP dehydrogenase [Candidatus Calescibacterium sp.]MCX7733935.1 acyl-CoA/acyl-ACP dehydrogenase [bacterium]MDW8086467.1 acyl-CoA dehydrogenase family protein [Candidatus Calescibacterium sp.]
MDFSIGPEIQMVKETADKIRKNLEGKRNYIFEKIKKREFVYEIWDELTAAGLLGAIVPTQYGGSGLGLLGATIITEELAKNAIGNALFILTICAQSCVIRNGSEELKRRFLSATVEGKIKCALGVTEAEAGSNTFRIKTIASKKNGYYVINGEKVWITGADVADYIMLITRTTPYQEVEKKGLPKMFGLSVFLVDLKSKGITITKMNTRGIEGMNQCVVNFENVEVPAENIIGQEDQGVWVLFNGLNPERILAGASAVGLSEYCLRKAIDYAKERVVFGTKPIGAYQAIQHPLADIKIRQESTRLIVYKAAWAYDNEVPPQEVMFLANSSKYLAAELFMSAVDRAIQTLGGAGFLEDNHLILLMESARLLKTAPLSNEMILNLTAEHILGLPRSY